MHAKALPILRQSIEKWLWQKIYVQFSKLKNFHNSFLSMKILFYLWTHSPLFLNHLLNCFLQPLTLFYFYLPCSIYFTSFILSSINFTLFYLFYLAILPCSIYFTYLLTLFYLFTLLPCSITYLVLFTSLLTLFYFFIGAELPAISTWFYSNPCGRFKFSEKARTILKYLFSRWGPSNTLIMVQQL